MSAFAHIHRHAARLSEAAGPSGADMASQSPPTPYDSASQTDARMASWLPFPGSADADMLPDLPLTVARTRDHVRNSATAGGYVQTGKDNIIGNQLRLSLRPDYRLLGRDADWARDWSTTAEAQFRTWANTTECDAARTQTLWGKARTALGAFLTNGDHITLPLWLPQQGAQWSTRLMGIEADRLSTPTQQLYNGRIRGGVEIDPNGAPVAYHIRKAHPGDWYAMMVPGYAGNVMAWQRVPAFTPWGRRRVLHVFDKERDEQNRGMTVFAKVLRESRVLTEAIGHENHAMFANSLIAGFLESDLPAEDVAALFGTDQDQAGAYWKTVSDRYHRRRLEGGMFMNLPIGTKLSSFQTNRPNVNFEAFSRFILRYMASGLNIPYELLLKDFSQTNYSSARAALLEAWRYFLACRQLFVDMWLNEILKLWMEEAVDRGRVDAPDFYGNEYAYCRARWIFAGRGWVDPTKEATAAQMRMDYHISTLEDECAEQGREWEESLEQEAMEKQRMMELDARYGLSGVYSLAAPRSVKDPSPASTDQTDKAAA